MTVPYEEAGDLPDGGLLPNAGRTPSFSTLVLRVEDDGYSTPGITLFACSLCGALVEDTGLHASWHETAPARRSS